ncbi:MULTISPECIES: LacI family DNA-binding transcriptional regulator [unclassified Agrococcus]|uniref:LacI family DNA-binding transcriptional regulator n=1 Tax=unclassified Agrococcus TaxID=2615065 RepID=UPI00361EB217
MARVRLIDVAERVGVSMKTVSNVVHGHPNVAPALRQRVQAAIDELGYRPNLTARRLATGKTGMIALAVPEMDHPYFAELSRNVAEVATTLGLRVIIEQTLADPAAEAAVLQDREQGLVDGVVFHPVSMDTLQIARLNPDTPLVLLGESAKPVTADHVMIDNRLAAADGTTTLLESGRRRVAFLGVIDHDATGSTALRLLGYQEALIGAGAALEPALVLPVGGFRVADAYAAMRAALEAGIEIDAVLCRDDRFAIGAVRAIADHGLRVPQDIAVVGWDDTELATSSTPTLTSISPDKQALAREALTLLIERIDGYTGIGRHRIVPHAIATRESSFQR